MLLWLHEESLKEWEHLLSIIAGWNPKQMAKYPSISAMPGIHMCLKDNCFYFYHMSFSFADECWQSTEHNEIYRASWGDIIKKKRTEQRRKRKLSDVSSNNQMITDYSRGCLSQQGMYLVTKGEEDFQSYIPMIYTKIWATKDGIKYAYLHQTMKITCH